MKSSYLVLSLLMLTFVLPAQVPEKDAVVAATKMNVLYRGISNPVEIAVPGVTSDKITAAMSNGTIKKAADGWEASPGDQNESVITVLVNNKIVSEKIFRVKALPVPIPVFAGKSTGIISKANAVNTQSIEAELKDFDWDLKFQIVSFNLLISTGFGDTELSATGNKLTAEMRSQISGLKSGQKALFKDIKAIGPDGRIRDLGIIILKIE